MAFLKTQCERMVLGEKWGENLKMKYKNYFMKLPLPPYTLSFFSHLKKPSQAVLKCTYGKKAQRFVEILLNSKIEN